MAAATAAMRQPQPAARRGPRLIAIASGTGGVGRTWLALAVAQALAVRRARPLVVEAGFGLADAGRQAGQLSGVDPAPRGEDGLADCIVPVPEGGFDLLAGEAVSGARTGRDAATTEGLVGRLHAAGLPHDQVLLDLGAGVEPATRALAALADTVILVTTEDPTSLTEGYAVVKRLREECIQRGRPLDVRVVVNRAESERSGRRTHAALARAARGFLRLDPPLLGVVPCDESVAAAMRGQRLFMSAYPKSPAAGAVQVIARRLLLRQGMTRADGPCASV